MNCFLNRAGLYEIWVWRNGLLIDVARFHNLFTLAGMDYMNNAALLGGSVTTAWYVALISTNRTPTTADTMTTLTGVEFTAYSGNRPQIVWDNGTSSGGVISNSIAKASYALTGSGTIYGAALCSGATKGNSSGLLLSIGNFDTAKGPLSSPDVVTVAYTSTSSNGP